MSAAHSRGLSVLQEDARTRARLAASFVDERMDGLLRTLKALSSTSGNSEDNLRSELDQKGILLFTRSENLDVLSPGGSLDASLIDLDGPARSAAETALSTMAPQITAFDHAPDKGIDVWIAAQSSGSGPILLQARIPSTYIASALKNFATGGPWSISVVGPDGHILAKTRGKSAIAENLIDTNNPALVEAVADTEQFGWKVAAQIPENAEEQRAGRNWITFATLSSLLAVASFAGATWLTRIIYEDPNASPTAGMTLPFNSEGTKPRSREPAGAREQRLRQALRAGNVGVWEWDLATGAIHWDAEISEILNDLQPAHDHPARMLIRRVERYDRRRLLKAIGAAITGATPLAVEVRVRRPNGETRWIAVRGAPTEADEGKVATLAGVAYDVTDQKLSLTRTDALLREVSHRSKNLLALILAMARLTARDAVDVTSHLKDFTLRVAGLAASQDLIVASDWQSVDFATLAAAEIGAVARTDAGRVSIMGPPVMLTPEAAQTLGMVLTELALNAVEHGALSAATGEVKLEWSFPSPTTIVISWRETGGPPFLPHGPKGYGMSVVERFSTQGLKLSAHADGNAHEFTWTLTGPLANIGQARKGGSKT
ncbi:sensor histidine kinase [Hyphomicrobium sp. 99]|uniref:sensor histidine kinase n=1 Tax=Hyphomicrobium sp. 99 TaxID=1163419 RepID=UPI0005F88B77|nr:sensor histidine kinase [Hyphomicrobium sp. 99]